ncbi:MAG TPA: AMP-binding protein [Syntrophorhabdaceae bacterium]|nr:AMP-binding protein [Syntrophorhabdaceae bacterium]
MSLDYPRHKPEQTEFYSKKRWWLGLTLGDTLDRIADVFPNKEALVDDKTRFTWSEVREKAESLAAGLLRIGIKKGDCVVLQLPNWAEYMFCYFAMQKIGAVPVILISGYKQLEVGHLCKLTEATAWIVPAVYRKIAYTAFVDEVKAMNPQLKHVISVRAEGMPKGFTVSLEELMAICPTADERIEIEKRRPEPTDVAHIIPSGGTTGLPKGIPRTHGDYLCNIEYLHRDGIPALRI